MPLLIGAIAVVLGLGGLYVYSNQGDTATTTEEAARVETESSATEITPESASADEPANNGIAAMSFADGTYQGEASYLTPRRDEHLITVELTVENDVVTAANVLYDGETAQTPMHQNFESAWEEMVVGQPLRDIDLSRVGGASLTSEAFNEAVIDIKAEATA